ncbi:hypothetical protein KAFR_0E00600 [Kazachstania africana CBS 2517]|uniref:Nucleolar 27S pre-rRNA processing Urb2/Npa2 C-terminal domain-containing protein n=1 Tax=Kazachstania africana (strain ATCC 22294 / BCRC 22015 / CBS 2517 / CECT 1963 / NBRC 1671 / NRRL Y-8276) TaxID=1071382 RepID=H2AV14_KAZAF|nr:hypothetical protein KAFR_0E00600 [Kazachstania africana CBS 2517]CCF58214.1 hypothetical protein KAFR_0E00600 [Kazachstania africana CBS 2517]
MAMAFPTSAEAMTKLLRSKEIKTEELAKIMQKFDDLTFCFPNKEIFAIELIQDRWNDVKRPEFKLDSMIWETYVDMWAKVNNDERLFKKIFKNLKFTNLLIQTFQIQNDPNGVFLRKLLRTCKLINSMVTIDVSFDNSCKLLAGALKCLLIVSIDEFDNTERNALLMELMTMAELDHIPEVTGKSSNIYCSTMLYPTINYVAQTSQNNADSVTKLSGYLGKFVFHENNNSNLAKLLGKFFETNKTLDSAVVMVLFQKAIQFLSKNNFKELEILFTFIVTIQPSITAALLNELSLSKKTMSHDFLTELFKKNLESNETHSETFWNLFLQLLNLDIEIGIENSDTLMNLIEENFKERATFVTKLWAKLVSCYINARELPQFLKKWQDYSISQQSQLFMETPELSMEVSKGIVNLSTSQLREILSQTVDTIINGSEDQYGYSALRTYLKGLPMLSFTILPEFKHVLSKIFEIEEMDKFWDIKYLILNVYDDILPAQSISTEEINLLLNHSDNESAEFYYYFFKLREYEAFDFTKIESRLMALLESDGLSSDARRTFLENTFVNWSSIINSAFSKENINKLISMIVTKVEYIDLLNIFFENDDFFEEDNIVFHLVNNISKLCNEGSAITFMTKIPLQCYNKNTRIELINTLSSKSVLTSSDINLLVHLLASPTFKSNIERQFERLQDLTSKTSDTTSSLNKFNTIVFETVWKNHVLQIKEATSRTFVDSVISEISDRLLGTNFDRLGVELAYSILTTSPTEIAKDLAHKFINFGFHTIKSSDIDDSLLSWMLNCLYTIFMNIVVITDEQKSAIKSITADLMKRNNIDASLLSSTFLLNSVFFDDKLQLLYAQYIVARTMGCQKDILLPSVEAVIARKVKEETGYDDFNSAFASTVKCFAEPITDVYLECTIELYQVQTRHISKGNTIGSHLFVKSIIEFYTNLLNLNASVEQALALVAVLQDLLVSKPWLFTQYCVEILFALCFALSNLIISASNSTENNDEIFIGTIKIISNILLVHRVKLSNRQHLVNTLLCQYLDIISQSKKKNLTSESAKALSRLITDFCEPSNISNNKNDSKLNSQVSTIRQRLRRDVPFLLIKYIHLSIISPFDSSIRRELTRGIFSIFNLLSQNDLSMVNSILDSAGKQYFRSLYVEYKKSGKWRED